MKKDIHPKHVKMLHDLFQEWAPLVNLHAKKIKDELFGGQLPPDIDEEDLHLPAMYGLMEAFTKFDPKGISAQNQSANPLKAYADRRIRGKMLDRLVSHDAIPKHIRAQAKNLASLNAKPAETKNPNAVEAPQVEVKEPTTPAVPSAPAAPKPEPTE